MTAALMTGCGGDNGPPSAGQAAAIVADIRSSLVYPMRRLEECYGERARAEHSNEVCARADRRSLVEELRANAKAGFKTLLAAIGEGEAKSAGDVVEAQAKMSAKFREEYVAVALGLHSLQGRAAEDLACFKKQVDRRLGGGTTCLVGTSFEVRGLQQTFRLVEARQ